MKAIQFKQYGDYRELQPVDLPQPNPVDGEVLVNMKAAAVNPLDNTVRLGRFPMATQPPLVLGNEGVGVVTKPGKSSFAVGTRVMMTGVYGIQHDGTWREYVASPAQDLVPVPDELSDVEAASVPVAYLTAQLALTTAGGLEQGKTLLIPAVGGSVGNAAYQLARAQGITQVITTVGSTAKLEQALMQGYEQVIDLSQEELSEGVSRLNDGAGVDVAIDSVGGPITGPALASLKQGGTLLALGYPAGPQVSINLLDLIARITNMIGFSLFFQPPEAFQDAYQLILRLLKERQIKPLVARTFSLAEAAEAQQYLIEERPFGKVVLTI